MLTTVTVTVDVVNDRIPNYSKGEPRIIKGRTKGRRDTRVLIPPRQTIHHTQ